MQRWEPPNITLKIPSGEEWTVGFVVVGSYYFSIERNNNVVVAVAQNDKTKKQ